MLLFVSYQTCPTRSAEKQSRLLAHKEMNPMICRWTPEKRLSFANEAFCRFFGCSQDRMIGDAIFSFALDQDARQLDSSLARLSREMPYTDAVCRFRIGDEIRWIQWTHQAFFDDDGQLKEIQSIASDVSQQKRIENSLRKEKKDLEQHVRERTAELEAKHKELERKNTQIKQLIRQTQSAMEADRRTIAKELHDSIGASLTAIKFSLEQRLSEMEEMPDSEHLPFEKILSYLGDTIKETKRISHGLRPSTLDDLGLLVTLEEHAKKLGDVYPGIHFAHNFEVGEMDIPEPLKIVIYRVVQEAANNACKHSGADTVAINLTKKRGWFILEVRDNGHGFEIETQRYDGKMIEGYGIENMRNRIEIFDGTFQIESVPGKGTSLKAYLPCNSTGST